MRIFIGGSLKKVPQDSDFCRQFVVELGTEIVRKGHVLLNGCRSSLDKEIAIAAQEWLASKGVNDKDKIISYCLKSDKPIHSFGTVHRSALLDWQMNHCELKVPEQIELAGATIFVAGSEGTFWAKNWASFAGKLILGIPRFGGAGETIYNNELEHLRETSPMVAGDYETLNSLSGNASDFAKEVIRLAEQVVAPRNVFTIMSFKDEFLDVFASCEAVCQKFEFEAERTRYLSALLSAQGAWVEHLNALYCALLLMGHAWMERAAS